MQRSTELAALSREHHVALELTLRLPRANSTDAETVTQATLKFWRAESREYVRPPSLNVADPTISTAVAVDSIRPGELHHD